MKLAATSLLTSVLTVVLLALTPAAGSAHHPINGKFDDTKPLTMSGVVTYVDWRNPHAHIFMNVLDGAETLNWAVELESPIAPGTASAAAS